MTEQIAHSPPKAHAASSSGDRLMTTAEAAHFLGIAEITLRTTRIRGTGPAFRKLGRSVRYAMSDLMTYIEASKRVSTSQAAKK